MNTGMEGDGWARFVKKPKAVEVRLLTEHELQDLREGTLPGIGFKEADLLPGAVLARNPDDPDDLWVIKPTYFRDHYEPECQPEMCEAQRAPEM